MRNLSSVPLFSPLSQTHSNRLTCPKRRQDFVSWPVGTNMSGWFLTLLPVIVLALVIRNVLHSHQSLTYYEMVHDRHHQLVVAARRESNFQAASASLRVPGIVPITPLYIITPCSRPEYLPAIRASFPDGYQWTWIIVYTAKPDRRMFVGKHDENVFEFWPGIKQSNPQEGEPSTFGNLERNYGISMVPNPSGFLYFLDDDNVVHPDFWTAIYPYLCEGGSVHEVQPDFITFDQLRGPNWLFPGPRAALFQIDTAMFVTRRSLVGNSRWHMTRYNADGLFAMDMAAKSSHHLYIECTCSYYNFLKQDFGDNDTRAMNIKKS